MRTCLAAVLGFLIIVAAEPSAAQSDRLLTYEEVQARFRTMSEDERLAWLERMSPEQRNVFAEGLGKEIDNKKAANDLVALGYKAADSGDNESAVRFLTEALATGHVVPTVLPGVYAYRGRAHRMLENHEQAIADLTEAQRLDPSLAAATYGNRAPSYAALGRYDDALADYGRAIAAEPDFPGNYVGRAEVWVNLDEHEKALEDCNRAIAVDPQYMRAWLFKAAILTDMGAFAEALPALTKVIEAAPDVAEFWKTRAKVYFNLAEHEAAVSDATKAIELDPSNLEAYFWRVQSNTALANLPAVEADVEKMLALSAPEQQDLAILAVASRAFARQQAGDFEGALEDTSRAIDHFADDPQLHIGRGQLYVALGRTEEAMADFNRAVALAPDMNEAYRQRSFLLMHEYAFERAIADLNKVVTLGGDTADNLALTLAARGYCFLQIGNNDQGLKDADEAIRFYPELAYAHGIRGTAFRYMSRFEEARTAYQEALRLNPADAEANYGTAVLLINDKAPPAEFMPYLQQAATTNPDYADVNNVLAWTYATSSDPAVRDGEKAIAHARAAVDRNPHPLFRDTLAAAYAEAGRFEQAVAQAEQAVADARKYEMTDLLPDLQSRLELFRNGQPYRE